MQGATLTGPFEYTATIDMSDSSSSIVLNGLDGASTYKIYFTISLYEGTLRCLISMLQAYLFFGKFSHLHALLGPTRLFNFGKNA